MDALKYGQALYKGHNWGPKIFPLYNSNIFGPPKEDNLLAKDKRLSQSLLNSKIPMCVCQ
jgi:hypothetical protein